MLLRPAIRSLKRLGLALRLAAVLLALLVVLGLGAAAWYERHEALENARARAALLAQVLEADASRTVETAALALFTLGDALTHQGGALPDEAQLRHMLLGLPMLRSVALLDEQGQVLASTQAHERGLTLPLARLGRLPGPGHEQLLSLQSGRGLADLVAGRPARPGLSMLPLILQLPARSHGPGRWLLALINPDALANFQQRALPQGRSAAWLASFDGQLLAATEAVSRQPGQSMRDLQVFQQALPRQDHGSLLGRGLLGSDLVMAYRAAPRRPLVVGVEQAQDEVLAPWRAGLRWLLLLGALALVLIATAAWVVQRSLRERAQAMVQLDQAHRQVARRERELSVLLKSVQELIFRTDARGVLTFVNARWVTLSPERVEQAIGQRLVDIVVPEDRAKVAQLFDEEAGNGARSVEASVQAADGSLRHFIVAVVPLMTEGQLRGFAGSAVDVTQRFDAEQRVQQQLAFTERLLEITPLPVSMFDAQGRYVIVNRAWEAFTGFKRQQVIGRGVGFFLPAEERRLHAHEDAQLMAGGPRLSYETQIAHRDGSRRDMLVSKVPVPDTRGGVAGVLCTLMDVSEFRAAERATRQARDAAEQASRAKTEFIANISHELRTPLQSILGFSELGLARGRDQPRLAAMFGDIHASGQRMLALVNDLLDVAKIESPVGTFDLERCDLRELVQQVVHELEPLQAKRGQSLELRLPEQTMGAKVDPLRFQQVVRNVLANAIKFSPLDSLLELYGEVTPQGENHLCVADRGPGIPPAELDHIFEAFAQSSATKDGSGGTGLGLAICRKILAVQGGRIEAVNRVGGGAEFHIYLPLRGSSDSQLSGLSTL